jgi:hypothetical protein
LYIFNNIIWISFKRICLTKLNMVTLLFVYAVNFNIFNELI